MYFMRLMNFYQICCKAIKLENQMGIYIQIWVPSMVLCPYSIAYLEKLRFVKPENV